MWNPLIRPATPDDAHALVGLLQLIARERIHTAIDQPWPAAAQRQHILDQSPRECIHVAESPAGELVGYQVLALSAASIPSMSHVGQLGTFLAPNFRRQGIGRALFTATLAFAGAHAYRKFVIQVRASNTAAQAFYQSAGFAPCGRYSRHVLIDGVEDDEILMEYFIDR
ncbi:MAG: N-acetyltransferase [Acidobacteriota bacterium]